MQLPKPVGRDASVRKYDLLSVLMAYGLSQDKVVQRQVLRLMALITTRYNWKRDELTMGQDEIARLWNVDTRTVKREMARLRALGWIVVKRQGARGHVSVLGIDLNKIFEDTRAAWPNIGVDFIERLEAQDRPAEPAGNVVPLRHSPARIVDDGSLWAQMQKQLLAMDAACFSAWYAPLREIACEEGCLVLLAPTKFHASYVETQFGDRLCAIARGFDPSVQSLRFEV